MEEAFTQLQSMGWVIFVIALWTLPWKGVALWKAAKNGHKHWFVVLLILNTVGILEIVYIFIFGKKTEDKDIINSTLNI